MQRTGKLIFPTTQIFSHLLAGKFSMRVNNLNPFLHGIRYDRKIARENDFAEAFELIKIKKSSRSLKKFKKLENVLKA